MPTPPCASELPRETLRALLDRLIPPDDFPGALAGGVERYLLQQLSAGGNCAGEAALIFAGLTQLDAEAALRGASRFSALRPEIQDDLLRDLECGRAKASWPSEVKPERFFARCVELTHEGFYADPANGGNQDGLSWKMIGYDPLGPQFPSDP